MMFWMLFGPIALTRSQAPYFGWIGEGYTAARESQGLQVSWRQFSAPDFESICASSPAPDQLTARDTHVELKIGETFSFRDLRVMALDSMGMPLDPVPIGLNMEAKTPAIVDFQQYRQSTGPLVAIGTGEFRVRIRTLCSEPPDLPRELIIQYSVTVR
jgi:hypothetical protein